MTRHDHSAFAEAYANPPIDHIVSAIDAEQLRLSELREWARGIVTMGARKALCVYLRPAESREIEDAAQRFLDEGGEDGGEFGELLDGLDDPRDATYALDADFLRDEACEWRAGL